MIPYLILLKICFCFCAQDPSAPCNTCTKVKSRFGLGILEDVVGGGKAGFTKKSEAGLSNDLDHCLQLYSSSVGTHYCHLLFILTSAWVLSTHDAGQILLFSCFFHDLQRFWCKNLAKWGEKEHVFGFFSNTGQHKNPCLAPLKTCEKTSSGTESFEKLVKYDVTFSRVLHKINDIFLIQLYLCWPGAKPLFALSSLCNLTRFLASNFQDE